MKRSSLFTAITIVLCISTFQQPILTVASSLEYSAEGPPSPDSPSHIRTAAVTSYEQLLDVISRFPPVDTILVGPRLKLTGPVSVSNNLLLRGNHDSKNSLSIITCTGDEPAFLVRDGAYLVLENLSVQNCGSGFVQVYGPGSFLVARHLQLTHHTITGPAALLEVHDGASALLEGCSIANNSFLQDASLLLVRGEGSALTITSSTESAAVVADNAGGVLVDARLISGQVNLTDCQFRNNSVRNLLEAQNTKIDLAGVQLFDNSLHDNALLSSECITHVAGLQAFSNVAEGGLITVQRGELYLENSTLANNTVDKSLLWVEAAKVELGDVQILHNSAEHLLKVENGLLALKGNSNIFRSNWAATLLTASHSRVDVNNTLLVSNIAMQDGWGVLINATDSLVLVYTLIAQKNGASVGLSLSRCSITLHNLTMEETQLHAAGALNKYLGPEAHAAELALCQTRLEKHGVALLVHEAQNLEARSCVIKHSTGMQVLMWQRSAAQLTWSDLGVFDVSEGGVVALLGPATLTIEDASWGQVQGSPALELYGGSTTVISSSFLRNTADVGAAISCTSAADDTVAASLKLADCSFSHNGAILQGGAVFVKGCKVEAEDVYFSDNWSPSGGAWACESCSAHLMGVVFHSNAAENGGPGLGGAMLFRGGVNVDIQDSYFGENYATEGGALALDAVGLVPSSGIVRVLDSQIWGNYALDGGGALWLSSQGNPQLLLTSTVLSNNSAPAHPGIQTPTPAQVQVCCRTQDSCIDFHPPGCPYWANKVHSGNVFKSRSKASREQDSVKVTSDSTQDLGLRSLTPAGCDVGETQKTEDEACMLCGAGTYTVNPMGECKDCPTNAVCTEGIFTPRNGWWTSSPLSDSPQQCLLRKGCQYQRKKLPSGEKSGNRTATLTNYIQRHSMSLIQQASRDHKPELDLAWMNLQCNQGYMGRLCSVCDLASNFGRWMGECTKCAPSWLFHAIQFILVVGFVASLLWQEMYGHLSAVFTTRASYYNAAPQEHASSPLSASIDIPVTKQGKNWVVTKIIKVMVSYVQVLSLLKYADLQLPQGALGAVFHQAIWLVDFTAPYTWFPMDCYLPALPTVSVTRVLFPLLLMVALMLFFLMVWVLVCLRQRRMRHPQIGFSNYIAPRWCLSCMHIVWFFYPAATAAVLSIFNCVDVTGPVAATVYTLKLKPKTGLYWAEDVSMKCYEGPHRLVLILAGVPGLLFITAGYPLLVITILVSHRHKLALKRTLIKYGFLYEEYHKGMYLWDLVVTMRKLLLVAVFVLLRHYANATAQLAAAEAVVLAAVVAQVGIRPFRYQLFNVMEALTLLAGALTFNVLLFDTIGAGFNETSRTAWTIIAMFANGLIILYYLGMAQWVECMYRNGNSNFTDNMSDVSSHDGDARETGFRRAVRKLLAVMNVRRSSRARGNGQLPGNSYPHNRPWTLSDGIHPGGLHHQSAAFDSISLNSSSNLGHQESGVLESGVLEVTEHVADDDLDVYTFDQTMLSDAPQAGQRTQ